MIINKEIVMQLFAYIGEGKKLDKLCDGPLCYLFGYNWPEGNFTSEFTLYTMFAYARTELHCTHSVEADPAGKITVSLWRGLDRGVNAATLERVARQQPRPLAFGAQEGSFSSIFRALQDDDRDELAVASTAINNLIKIYMDAELVDGHPSPEDVLTCVVGQLPDPS